jgi:phosphate transport system protein
MTDDGWFAELDGVDADFRRMAARTEGALADAVGAVLGRDPERAARVAAGEPALDEMECRLEDRCYRILLLFHPVARDLRQVTAVARMAAELERIGDLAAGVAERAAALAALPPYPVPAGLAPLAAAAAESVRAAVDAYLRRDPASARAVCRGRSAVVALGGAVAGELAGRMKADPAAVEPGLNLIAVVQYLRRVAEVATNLAEDAVFLAEGRSIRHHWDGACLSGAG